MARATPESPLAFDLPGGAERQLLDLVAARLSVVLYRGQLAKGKLNLDFVSPGAEQQIGKSAEQLCGRENALAELIHPDDRVAYEEALAAVLESGAASVDYRVAVETGVYAWRRDEMSLAASSGKAASDPAINGCIVSIEQEKDTEPDPDALAAQRAAIIDQAAHPIVLSDREGRIAEINRAAVALFFADGQSSRDASRVSDLFDPDSRSSFLEAVDLLLQTAGEQAAGKTLTLIARHSDGRDLPVEVMLSVIDLGEDRAIVTELRDISERVTAEAAISHLWQLLQDAVESIPNGFAIYDVDDKLVLCNAAFSEIYDLTPQAMVGSSTYDNYCDVLPQLQSIDGEIIEGLSITPELWLSHVRQSESEPVEFQLKSGAWKQTTTHPIHGGGRVYVRTDITKLKEAEISLRKSEQQFRSLVENNPFPLWLTDVDTGIVLYHSPAAAALLGYDWPVTQHYKSERAYADPADRRHCTDELLAAGRLDGRETLFRKADGTVFWGAVFSRLCEHDGKTIAIGGVVDLTEQRDKETQLRQAQETLQDAVESLSEGFALYDAEDRLVTCNQRYREFNKLSNDVLEPGVRWADFIRTGAERGQYVGAEGRVEEWLEERRNLRLQFGTDLEFQQADGRWFQFTNQPTRQGGIVVTRTDITNRKEMERALRESENLVRSILEASPVPVAMTRASDGLIIYESPASRALFGQMQRSGEATYIADLYVDPRDRQRYLTLLRERRMLQGFEVELRKADGGHVWASLTASLIEYQGEEMIVASAYDQTERRAAETEMARHREALYQSEKLSALGSLLAGVAHELNNPLSVVVGHAQLLKETASDARIIERATKIGNAADRCSRIVKSFLAMARQRPPERRVVDLCDIVQATLDVTGYSLRTANIDIIVDIDPKVPPVWADPDQMNQVVTNLTVNAQQAMMEVRERPRELKITARYDNHRQEVVLEVADTGTGIPEEICSRVFEPFFTTKEIGEGTGIGLAVSHRIVEAHDGRIRVDSEVGRGSTFTVSLPASWEKTREPSSNKKTVAGCLGAKASILIIDDEPDVAQMLCDILATQGHRVETAESGEKALTMLDASSFDVILSDVRMPHLDGPSLYAALERRDPDLLKRTAFVSGDTLSPSARAFLKRVHRPFIEKPFTLEEVRDLVDRILGREQEQRSKAATAAVESDET
ncbi:PAS domain S-box protein [Pelagibius litoralis]|uniref:histidine kinase n=1 Tax=Pelagibius litoralis TaxID=374515 RepID=A0A967F2C0_9PROT|nr:PAS domain S-box protein [Pelagibius litoralis]NIA71795.1 PAS domain S-box protein [Pelagibius litoralis]